MNKLRQLNIFFIKPLKKEIQWSRQNPTLDNSTCQFWEGQLTWSAGHVDLWFMQGGNLFQNQ